MKIFQIGFNRCGTKTIHDYLSANGVRSVHWDKGRLAKRMFCNIKTGRPILYGYDSFEAFSDMEWIEPHLYLEGYKLYADLAAEYPDAVFILNTRDREAWIRSRLAHGGGRYAALHMSYFQIRSKEALAEHWRREWEEHHFRVMEFFSGKPHRFLLCRIECDMPHALERVLPELRFDRDRYRVSIGGGPSVDAPVIKKLRAKFKRKIRAYFNPW